MRKNIYDGWTRWDKFRDWLWGFHLDRDIEPWKCRKCGRKIYPFVKNIGYFKCRKCERKERMTDGKTE